MISLGDFAEWIAFAWSWVFWMPEVLWNYRLYLAPFGPSVAAFVLTYLNGEKEGVLKLLKKGIDYRFPKVWYLPVFLLMPFITGFPFATHVEWRKPL